MLDTLITILLRSDLHYKGLVFKKTTKLLSLSHTKSYSNFRITKDLNVSKSAIIIMNKKFKANHYQTTNTNVVYSVLLYCKWYAIQNKKMIILFDNKRKLACNWYFLGDWSEGCASFCFNESKFWKKGEKSRLPQKRRP